jgi:chemotaxis protein histidine kinase CheA
MDLSDFLPEFLVEAQKLLDRLAQVVSEMLAEPQPPAIGSAEHGARWDELFRVAHSLKGTISFLFQPPITRLALRMEEAVQGMRRGEASSTAIAESALLLPLLSEGIAGLRTMLSAVERGEAPPALPDLEHRLERWS